MSEEGKKAALAIAEQDDYWIRLNLTRKRYDALVMALRFHQAESNNKNALAATRDLLRYVETKDWRGKNPPAPIELDTVRELPLNIPIPLRHGLHVLLEGVPRDMTAEEAETIAKVVQAMVQP